MNNESEVSISGVLKKRAGRYSRWCDRYFTLSGSKLEYKLTQNASEVRATFELSPGCMVTDISVEGQGIRAKKLYTFWIVWPHDKNREQDNNADQELSDDEENDSTGRESKAMENDEPREKGLKKLLTDQQQNASKEKKIAQKQIEMHQSHDNTVGMVPKVAAVAIGGLVVGALTAGVGLVPFIAVVGGFAVAGGSTAALNYHRPLDSRLVMASDNEDEARKWMNAIIQAVSVVEKRRGPRLPSGVNARLVSTLTKLTHRASAVEDYLRWRRYKTTESTVRMLELTQPPTGFQYRRAHIIIPIPPQEVFLALMETPPWPGQQGSLRVLQVIDNNTDIICVRLCSSTDCRSSSYKMCTWYLSRFWRITDDGCYLITLNGISVHDIRRSRKGGAVRLDDEEGITEDQAAELDTASPRDSAIINSKLDAFHTQPAFNAVLTIAPRKDHAEFDNEVPEALVCCSIQVANEAGSALPPPAGTCMFEAEEREEFCAHFMHACLVDLRRMLTFSKYSYVGNNCEGLITNDSLYQLNAADQVRLSSGALGRTDSEALASTTSDTDAYNPASGRASGLSGSEEATGTGVDTHESSERRSRLSTATVAPLHASATLSSPRALHDAIAQQNSSSASNQNSLGPLTRRMGLVRRTLANEVYVSSTTDNSSLPGKPEKFHPSPRKANTERFAAKSASTSTTANDVTESTTMRSNSGKSRSSVVNNEAAALRGQIAAKEYELHRLQRVAYKRNEPSATEAMTLVQHQTNELQALKAQYQQLTGSTYEQVNSNRRLTAHQLTSLPATSSETSLTRGDGGSNRPGIAQLTLPPHWQPTKMERAELRSNREQLDSCWADAIRVLLISFCMLAIIVIGNLFPGAFVDFLT